MDIHSIMDIQAVESKLSDVTVTPIPRSQVQNFYNYQQQRDQREQQPQIQISAIHHHTPRDRSGNDHHHAHHSTSNNSGGSSARDIYAKQRERDYHHHHQQQQQQQQQQHHHHTQQQQSNAASSSSSSAAAAVAVASALQYTQQLQAQLALLQQQAGSPTVSRSINGSQSAASSSNINTQSQLKYPLSTSPVIVTTQTSANITTPMTSTANLPTVGSSASTNGLTKYAQLLAVIEEMGRDIRPTYTGSRNSTERLKRGIVHARILVRECLMETERSARQ